MASSSVFSAMPIEACGRNKKVLIASWCSAKEPALLGVAIEGGTVLVLEEDGTLHDEVVRNRPSNDIEARGGGEASVATCLGWSSTALQRSMPEMGSGRHVRMTHSCFALRAATAFGSGR